MPDVLKTTLEMVEEFHEAFGQPAGLDPFAPVQQTRLENDKIRWCASALEDLTGMVAEDCAKVSKVDGQPSPTGLIRLRLLIEELAEFAESLSDNDPVAQLDALVDLQYVLDGSFLSMGLDKFKRDAFLEVHASNMSKLGEDGKPIRREGDGKVLKGPNYFKPDIKQFVKARDEAA